MAKIIVEDIQGGSGGQALTIPTARASVNNQPVVGSTAGVLSHSPLSLPAAASGAANRPLVGATNGATSFYSVALPSADGSANQYLQTNGSGQLSFVSIADPTVAIKSASDPDVTVAQGALGDFFVNTTSGENFVCTFVGTGATKRRWVGNNGTNLGFPQGQAIYYPAPVASNYQTSSDTQFSCTVPTGVTSVCVVLVGGGGGGNRSWATPAGGGGALAYKNNITVTPADVLYITVGKGGQSQGHGGDTVIRTGSHSGTVLFTAKGGQYNATAFSAIAKPVAGSLTPDNVDNGHGGLCSGNGYVSGGGAGGYSGNGGNGEYGNSESSANSNNTKNAGGGGTGGAGGGGSGYPSSTYGGGGGGGVGLYGEGASGSHNANNSNSHYSYASGNHHRGYGGSGGENGNSNSNTTDSRTDTWGTTASSEANLVTITGSGTPTGSRATPHGQGGFCGGGGAGGGTSNSNGTGFCGGAAGGARVIWGPGRSFPKTNTGNVTTVAG